MIVQIDPQFAIWDEREKNLYCKFSVLQTGQSPFHTRTVFDVVLEKTFVFKRKIMSWFEYRDGVLHAEDVRVQTLADRFSTPLYVYSKAGIEQNLRAYQEAMGVGLKNKLLLQLDLSLNVIPCSHFEYCKNVIFFRKSHFIYFDHFLS